MISSHRQSVIVIAFTIMLVILVNITWWVTYARTETRFEYQLSRRLATTARMGAADFTPDLVSSLVGGHLSAYDSTLNLIERMRQMDPLSEVFVIGPDLRYFATTLSMPDSVYYLAALNSAYLDSAFALYDFEPGRELSANAVVTEGYPVGEIYLKSAFVPLVDTAGVVSAVLGIEADIDYTDVLGDLRRNLYLSSAFSIGGGVLFGLFFFFIQRRLGRAERTVLQAQAQANLGRMVAVVSHEIKNPLMIMRASAERLHKDHNAPEAVFLLEEVDRLNAIVSGYLDIAGGKKILIREVLEPESLIKRIVDQFQTRLAGDGITLKLQSSDMTRTITADPVALRQVIINIVLNAVEAVKGKDDAQITIVCRNDRDRMIIEIADNGSGIDKNSMQHIFDPFYTTRTTGSGLGLFHSKRLLEDMGGRITITSKPGGPTVVGLEFVIQKQGG